MTDFSHTLVLFDLDGTLIDSASDLCAAANRLRTRRNIPALQYEALREYCGRGARGLIWETLRVAPGAEVFEMIKTEFLDDYCAHMNEKSRLFDGVPEMLAQLPTWGIVTNKSARFARPIALEKGLLPTARCLLSGSDMGKMKPLPDPLLAGAAACGLAPEEYSDVFYVGDDLRDAQAARAAGMRFIAAAWGYTKAAADIHDWGADAVAASPRDLKEIIGGLLS